MNFSNSDCWRRAIILGIQVLVRWCITYSPSTRSVVKWPQLDSLLVPHDERPLRFDMLLPVLLYFQHLLVWRCWKLLILNIVVNCLHVASYDWIYWREHYFTHGHLVLCTRVRGTWHCEIVSFISSIEALTILFVRRGVLREWRYFSRSWSFLFDVDLAFKMDWQSKVSSAVDASGSLSFWTADVDCS